jgi:hypothetical protein
LDYSKPALFTGLSHTVLTKNGQNNNKLKKKKEILDEKLLIPMHELHSSADVKL